MHIEDAHDDKLVADETVLHIHRRAQTRDATVATALDDPIIPIVSADDQPERSIQKQVTPTNMPLAHASTRATDEVALQDNLTDHNKLVIARAFLRHSIEFVLSPHYRPDVVGEMRVIGVDTKKLTKTKAVRLTTPRS